MSKSNTNTIIKHTPKNIISLDLSPNIRKRRSLISVTDSSEILSTKISCKQSNLNKRPSIYTTDMVSKSFKDQGFRKDVYGTLITKGSKEHKVSFVDNVSRKGIAEIILIEAENLPNGKKYQTQQRNDDYNNKSRINGKLKSRNNKRCTNEGNCSCGSGDCCVV